MYGSLPYVAKNLEHLRDKTVAAVCCDTTAEDYDLATTSLSISLNPNVCPTFADAVFPEIVRRYYARYNPEPDMVDPRPSPWGRTPISASR